MESASKNRWVVFKRPRLNSLWWDRKGDLHFRKPDPLECYHSYQPLNHDWWAREVERQESLRREHEEYIKRQLEFEKKYQLLRDILAEIKPMTFADTELAVTFSNRLTDQEFRCFMQKRDDLWDAGALCREREWEYDRWFELYGDWDDRNPTRRSKKWRRK